MNDVRHPLEWIAASQAPETPAHLNRIGIRRYERAASDGRRPDTALLLMPGFTGGVNDFDLFATAIAAALPGVSVWALERRNQLLEDLRGMEAAEAAANPEDALHYYFGGGGPPMLSPAETPWMGEWGLAVALADLRAAVRRAREAVGTDGRVLIGGHSMGGMLAQCYAAWEFDEGPGYAEVDGLVLLDGAVGGPEWTATIGMAQFEAGRAALGAGEVFWNEPGRGASPRTGVLAQVAAMAATLPEWRQRPSLLLPLVAGIAALPERILLTNEAAFGYLVDSETGPIPTYRACVGMLDPAPILQIEGCPLHGWRSHRDCERPTDLAAIAAALRQIDGTNGLEWYASRRLNAEIDLSSNLESGDAMTRDLAEPLGLRLRNNTAMPRPVFAVVTRSEQQSRARYDWYRAAISGEVTLLALPEFDHLDPLFADPESNPCVQGLAEWIAGRR